MAAREKGSQRDVEPGRWHLTLQKKQVVSKTKSKETYSAEEEMLFTDSTKGRKGGRSGLKKIQTMNKNAKDQAGTLLSN